MISVCWRLRDWLITAFAWYPTDLDVSDDTGTTWHLRQQFGAAFSSGPARVVDADEGSGFLWSNGASTNGSTVYPTSLHYGTIYGYERFGPSKPGTGGIAPHLALAGAPRLGNAVTVTMTDAVGGAIAMLGVSLAGEANTPLGSSVLLLATPAMGLWGTATGTVGLAGAGSFALPFAIPSAPSLHRQHVTFQGFALDGNAAEGFASTAGLTMVIL